MSNYIKQIAKQRRTARHNREKTWVLTQQGKDASKKLAETILRKNAGQLVKFIQRSAQRAVTAKDLLEKMHPQSTFRPGVEHELQQQLIRYITAKSELDYRTLSLKEKITRNANNANPPAQ